MIRTDDQSPFPVAGFTPRLGRGRPLVHYRHVGNAVLVRHAAPYFAMPVVAASEIYGG